MSAPLPVHLTPRAKSVVAAVAATVLAGITAWQTYSRDGFTWADVAPVAVAVLGVIGTDLIPNTGNQPVAKAIVHGALAVASAVTTVIAADPSGYTAAKLLTVAAGAFLVWFVPELAPAVKVIEGEVAADVSASMGPDLPAAPVVPAPRDLSETQPFQAVTDAQPAQKGA